MYPLTDKIIVRVASKLHFMQISGLLVARMTQWVEVFLSAENKIIKRLRIELDEKNKL